LITKQQHAWHFLGVGILVASGYPMKDGELINNRWCEGGANVIGAFFFLEHVEMVLGCNVREIQVHVYTFLMFTHTATASI
jgi:hypothetical protein